MPTSERSVMRELGERISQLRRRQGWKQRELAGQLGCTLQQASKLERGVLMPRVSLLLQAGRVFSVSTDYLLTGQERKPEADLRLRERLPALEGLPEPQRDALIEFLDALVMAHRCVGSSKLEGLETP